MASGSAHSAALLALALALALLAPPAAADGDAPFTVIIRASGPVPGNASIEENITILWINTDDTENVTHRILLDTDGDGIFNGSADIISGELQAECEKDENGTLLDEDCSVSFKLTFNGTLTNGTFAYLDRPSSGTTHYGNITVEAHGHGEEGEDEAHDDSHSHDDEEPTTESERTVDRIRPPWLLLVAGLSAGGAALLALLIRQGGSG
jgi:hypothetical protein